MSQLLLRPSCPHVCSLHLCLSITEQQTVLVAQSYQTVCYPMDCSPPSSSVHDILQVRMLELAATPFCRGSSQPWDWTWVSHTAGRFYTIWATREACFSLFLLWRQDHLYNFFRFHIHILICIFFILMIIFFISSKWNKNLRMKVQVEVREGADFSLR